MKRKRRLEITERLMQLGAIAIVRLSDERVAMRAIEAVHAGGVKAIEITMTTPNAYGLIERVARTLGDDVFIGAGTVLDIESVARAVEAGARYIVSPILDLEVVKEAHRFGIPAIPGAYTPAEILCAHRAGAEIVKVFPAETLGPGYLKSILATMPFLRLMPTGGVTPENAGEWIAAGAVAVGVGSALLDPTAIVSGEGAALTARAERLVENIATRRSPRQRPKEDERR